MTRQIQANDMGDNLKSSPSLISIPPKLLIGMSWSAAYFLSSVILSSCGFGTRSEVNERPEAATSAMKIHAGKWKGYGDMEKM